MGDDVVAEVEEREVGIHHLLKTTPIISLEHCVSVFTC